MHTILDDNGEEISRSSSCLLPQWNSLINSQPTPSFSYDRLPPKPFRLTVLKLDGTSFGIEVSKMGMVRDVKQAVERSFPNNGLIKVSWGHVWGHFCLSFDGTKLLNDGDRIGFFGINDGDQLQFVRHSSSTYNMMRTQSEKEDLDLDNEPSFSNCLKEEPQNDEKNYCHRIDIEDNGDDCHTELDTSPATKRLSGLSRLFRCWSPYRKLSRPQMRAEKRSSSLKVSHSVSFKNAIRSYNNTTNSWRQSWKRKYDWV